MNVNLNTAIDRHSLNDQPLGNSPSIYDLLRNSAQVLAEHEDTKPVGPPVLVPEIQTTYPGAYQVWYPTSKGWIYVNPKGEILTCDSIAPADELWAWRSSW